MDPVTLSSIVVSAIAPFTPYLLKIVSSVAESLSQKMAEEGGEKAWDLAQSLWEYLMQEINPDGEIEDATRILAHKPEDQDRQVILSQVIASQLAENPNAARDLESILGGPESIQKIVAANESQIENVTQYMKGRSGQQIIEANNKSKINGVNQIQD